MNARTDITVISDARTAELYAMEIAKELGRQQDDDMNGYIDDQEPKKPAVGGGFLDGELADIILTEAVTFLAKYENAGDNTFKSIIATGRVKDAVKFLVHRASTNKLIPGDFKAGVKLLLRLVTKLTHQASSVVFFELYGRELRARRAQQSQWTPVYDASLHNEDQKNAIAEFDDFSDEEDPFEGLIDSIGAQRTKGGVNDGRITSAGSKMSADQAAYLNGAPAVKLGGKVAGKDPEGLALYSDAELKATLIDINLYFSGVHSAAVEILAGRKPEDPLGFMAYEGVNGWVEVRDYDEAYQRFQENRERKFQNRQAAAHNAAAALLKAFC